MIAELIGLSLLCAACARANAPTDGDPRPMASFRNLFDDHAAKAAAAAASEAALVGAIKAHGKPVVAPFRPDGTTTILDVDAAGKLVTTDATNLDAEAPVPAPVPPRPA